MKTAVSGAFDLVSIQGWPRNKRGDKNYYYKISFYIIIAAGQPSAGRALKSSLSCALALYGLSMSRVVLREKPAFFVQGRPRVSLLV